MKTIAAALFVGLVGLVSVQPALAAEKETVVHSFGGGTDGANPEAGLIDVDGKLYGTTGAGGGTGCTNNLGCGTVFELDPATGAEAVLYSFCSQQNCTDGQYPSAGLVAVNGSLYGTTTLGGTHGYGTAFAVDPNSGAEKVLHSFGARKDGFNPSGGLISVNGMLYGATYAGAGGNGTVYALDPGTGAETVLYRFCRQQSCADGSEPFAGLVGVNGMLYGTTSSGGTGCARRGACGTVFRIDPNTHAETVIHSFCKQLHCADGRFPRAGLVDAKGTLYGTTFWGGADSDCGNAAGCGTVFALDLNSGKEQALYALCSQPNCADGSEPVASLIDVKGTLYGTTLYGGDKACGEEYRKLRCGTVFALDTATGAETVLYSFCHEQNCTDGEYPEAGLKEVSGTLYGTTVFGGASGHGTVFALKP